MHALHLSQLKLSKEKLKYTYWGEKVNGQVAEARRETHGSVDLEA
jgi:hypothetical protein